MGALLGLITMIVLTIIIVRLMNSIEPGGKKYVQRFVQDTTEKYKRETH